MLKTSYNKEDCQTGIVHIGYGAFHRAHQAVYIDDYMDKTGDLSWGISTVNLINEGDIEADDYIVKTPTSYRLVRSHTDYTDWTRDRKYAKYLLTLPDVKLITITVTESGYAPGSRLFEYLACGLRNRKVPITILSCDNIRQNGLVLETQFLAYLYQTNQHTLAEWVKENVKFPSSMVDRITPRTTNKLKSEIAGIYPEYAETPVQTEDFSQWIIEDKFASDFPDLTKVGVIITDNLEPYEETKIRVLNGGHTSMAYIGVLAGYETFDQLMAEEKHRKHFINLQNEEIIPSIDIELPFDIHEYAGLIEERVSNPSNEDVLERICMDGFTKFHTFVLPSLEKCLEMGKTPIHIYKGIVAWYFYARKFANGCFMIKYNEPNWKLLEPLLENEKLDDFIENERLWGNVPKLYPQFKYALKAMLLSKSTEKEIDLLC